VSYQATAEADILSDKGYFVWRGLLGPGADLDPVVREYEARLDHLAASWSRTGALAHAYQDLEFGERLTRIGNATGGRIYQYFDISLPSARTTATTPIHLGPAVFDLLTNKRLLDAVEVFIGSDVLLHPIQHSRIKPPETQIPTGFRDNTMVAQTCWHQDQGVVREDADGTDMLTVWIPITDATIENGCLEIIPRSHKHGLLLHCMRSAEREGLHIPKDHVPDGATAIEMKAGDVLFMHRLTAHRSLPNRSNGIRWSFDLRYCPVGQPTGSTWAPSFIVRSRSQPGLEVVNDHEAWQRSWLETRERIAQWPPQAFRWDPNDIRCA
jgi:ectoine hydroxylase-related dioxygenase (phytanoyl-CoA dioxygenase family)